MRIGWQPYVTSDNIYFPYFLSCFNVLNLINCHHIILNPWSFHGQPFTLVYIDIKIYLIDTFYKNRFLTAIWLFQIGQKKEKKDKKETFHCLLLGKAQECY